MLLDIIVAGWFFVAGQTMGIDQILNDMEQMGPFPSEQVCHMAQDQFIKRVNRSKVIVPCWEMKYDKEEPSWNELKMAPMIFDDPSDGTEEFIFDLNPESDCKWKEENGNMVCYLEIEENSSQ